MTASKHISRELLNVGLPEARDREPAAPPVRTVLRFDWRKVDPELLRAMLVSVYEEADRHDDARLLDSTEPEALAAQAAHALGRPLSIRHMDVVVDVLRKQWLPSLKQVDPEELIDRVKLGLAGPERTVTLTDKASRLAFLARRRRTENFKLTIRAAFVRAHKAESPLLATHAGGKGHQREVVDLVGLAEKHPRKPYPHQIEAWEALDAMANSQDRNKRSGLVVLPTGSGKTFTLVAWLLKYLSVTPETRILWIADQQELLEQAARAFNTSSETMPADFIRRLRVIHGAAHRITTLADPDLDIALVTRQSLIGKRLDAAAQARLRTFLSRPAVVVIDEAHHAVSPTYQQLLTLIQTISPDAIMIGMTATPWPTGSGMTRLLLKQFPTRIIDVQTRELVRTGILATPALHTVDTGVTVVVDPVELSQMVGHDIPPSVLRRLDQGERNTTIVNTWLKNQKTWGKTLVFACDILHADNLCSIFTKAGANTTVVHNRAEIEVGHALREFRQASGPTVLVSVGMLLEGVDLPDARTAFLTRPTTSRILMRQMIGRVLRGPAAGGECIAHIVDLRDRWDAEIDILDPGDISLLPPNGGASGGDVLPPILVDGRKEPLSEDMLRRIEAAYGVLRNQAPPTPSGASQSSTLVGFYELGDVNVPVFDHVKSRWEEVVNAELGLGKPLRRPLDLFGDLPVPRPVKSDVDAVVEFVCSYQREPPLVAARSTMSVRQVAEQLLELTAVTERERVDWLRDRHGGTLNRYAFPSFQVFHEAVQQELLAITGGAHQADPENLPTAPLPPRRRPALGRQPDRQLDPLLRTTGRLGRQILLDLGEGDYAARLAPSLLPAVGWTLRPVRSTFAYWAPRISGPSKGKPVIRVNLTLQAPPEEVADELLQSLLWHELCHHLLPAHGHDAEFRRLEALWPDYTRFDFELDALRERYDLHWDQPQKGEESHLVPAA